MADLFENPLGTDGFEFVEYCHSEPEKLKALFVELGFKQTGHHMQIEKSDPVAARPDQLHHQRRTREAIKARRRARQRRCQCHGVSRQRRTARLCRSTGQRCQALRQPRWRWRAEHPRH